MAHRLQPIVDVLIAPEAPTGGAGPVSLGLLLDDGATHWGDVAPPVGVDRPAVVAAALRLRDRITPALSGQWPESLRDVAGRAREAAAGEGTAGEALSLAVQWAYLAGSRAAPDAAGRLRREFAFPEGDTTFATPVCFLEIGDYAATAERIDAMIALRPAGIGYRLTGGRVAEAIGPNAEHLQRFVRELGRRAATLAPGENYRPAMYLALNGALGELAGDPVRHIGKVLGNVVGLQTAAGERRLILEEPFQLDDALAQAANLHRLKEFIRRTPDSLKRAAPTLLVAPAPPDDDATQVYADTTPVHALVLDFPRAGPDRALAAAAQFAAAGLSTYWRLAADATPRQVALAIFLAGVARSATVLVNCDSGATTLPTLALRLLLEQATEQNARAPGNHPLTY